MNIQLSISLLASGRAASLERCLDSLRPLMMQVPSELIVVFTGTDERVREIAERYTDQVIPFTWCNDFSAARNAGLKAARGEWFMYIDDDEWFEDTTEIRDFFLSGECQNFGAACYIQRNYLSWDGIRHSDFHAFRMARNVPGMHFKNPIHEEMAPRLDPCKYFDSYVHHYGYVLENKSDKEKTERNVPLLLEAIHENPSYIKNYIQLVQEYCTESDWENAEKYCRKASILKMEKYERNWFQVYLGDILYAKKDNQQAVLGIVSILEKERPCELVRLSLYSKLTALYTDSQTPEKVIHYGILFEKTLIYMDNKPWLWQEQGFGGANEGRIKAPDKLYLGRMRCTEAALKLEDIKKALYFLNLLPWNEEAWMQQYYSIYDQWRGKYGKYFHELMRNVSYDAPYLRLQKAWNMKTEEESDIRQKMFRQCMSETDSLYLRQQILEEAINSEMDLSLFMDLLDMEIWKVCAVRIVDHTHSKKLYKIQKAAEHLMDKNPLHGLWLSKLVWEKELVRGFYSGTGLMDALSEYCQCVLRFYQGQYRKELFNEERYSLLPWDCRFAILAAEGLRNLEKRCFPEAVRRFRSSLQYYPGMTGVLHEVIRLMARQADNPASNTGAEFQALAVQMKEALKVMLEKGQYTEAMSVAKQLSSLLPDDLELLRLRQNILHEKTDL